MMFHQYDGQYDMNFLGISSILYLINVIELNLIQKEKKNTMNNKVYVIIESIFHHQ